MKLTVFKDLEKYSFITKTKRSGDMCFVYYEVCGKEKFKKFPLRTSIPQLQKILKEIQKEAGVNYYGKPKIGECYVI